jgi:hypothetical protein
MRSDHPGEAPPIAHHYTGIIEPNSKRSLPAYTNRKSAHCVIRPIICEYRFPSIGFKYEIFAIGK